MRLAMTNPALRKLAAKRTAKYTGMTEQQFDEMVQYMDRSGRFQIDQTIAEINGSYDMSRSITGYNIREKGRVFFNEGERVVRLMATNVSYREFRLKFPDVDISTDAGYRLMDEFITHRADVLTLNMTSASAAGWQKGLLSIPTQWLSYNARMLENLYFGRNLERGLKIGEDGKLIQFTGLGERERLALGQLAFYGAAGYGLGGPMNALIDKYSIDMDPEVYTLLRYGMADYLMSELTGVQTGLGGRLAVGEGLVDFVKDLTTESFVETIGGPSATIAVDAGKAGISLIGSLTTLNPTIVLGEFNKVMRNISSWDKGARSLWILQTGDYLSKKGEVQASGLSPEAAILNMLGAKLQEVEMLYELNSIVKNDKDMVQQVSNDVRELTRNLNAAYMRDDDETAGQLLAQINSLMAPLTLSQREQVRAFTRPSLNEFGDRVIEKTLDNGRSTLANQYNKIRNTGAN
jgi:hypothetical protein